VRASNLQNYLTAAVTKCGFSIAVENAAQPVMSKAHNFPRQKMQFSVVGFCVFRGIPWRNQNMGSK